MISKIKNSTQDIPIKSVRSISKNSTKNYKNIIIQKTVRIQAAHIGYPAKKPAISNLSRMEGVWDEKKFRNLSTNRLLSTNRFPGSCSTLL